MKTGCLGLIIVEGMDNTGKTTLIKALSKEFHLQVRHSPSHLIGTPELMMWVEDELNETFEAPPIYDRFPLISEEVYGPILRGSSDAKDRFPDWAKQHCVLFVYCKPPIDRVLDFGTREQMEGVVTHAKRLYKQYDLVMRRFCNQGWGIVQYDYTNMCSYGRVRAMVQQYIDKYPRRGTW